MRASSLATPQHSPINCFNLIVFAIKYSININLSNIRWCVCCAYAPYFDGGGDRSYLKQYNFEKLSNL
ncbi:MAG: hypothetical protein ACKPGD_14255 [Planktothrix sp.]